MFVLIAVMLLSSCKTPKDIAYMQGFDQGDVQAVVSQRRITLQPDDKVSIVVSSKDPELARVFNLSVAQVRVGQDNVSSLTSNSQVSAYTVSPDGNIDYPLLGSLHVAGMSRMEVAKMIEAKLLKDGYLKDPVVTVEFLNATISVLGEVNSPGEYPISRDNMTLLQALGKAGDLKITGMRKNVLVVREENGKDVAYRLDLTDANLSWSLRPIIYSRMMLCMWSPTTMRSVNQLLTVTVFLLRVSGFQLHHSCQL